ncbi:hypothetical protein [Oceanirhabdus sp. W0125-5]|uniref:hypothetical protein n=1 Tax=Oceanirhabdus sp. W0125-5 TaxID=2999116 RepID=UPI0022F2E15D|nr:hypothetical protein [Oceanirhabdus sp. W0125-5]WBW97189.1 hypothetical protein OW730_26400 [Oceanirhabdus sp. W0125-5]
MNLDREIKGFQTLFWNLLMFIIWCDVVNILFMFKVNHSLFIIVFIASILLMVIYEIIKEKSKYNFIALIMPSISILLIFYSKYQLDITIFNMIYGVLVLIIIYRTKDTIMGYSSVRKFGQIAIIAGLFTGVISIVFVRNILFEDLIKYILMLIISNVILLRGTRCYSYNLNDKKMRIMNIGVVIFFFIILSEKVEKLIMKVFSISYQTFSYALEKITYAFFMLTKGVWEYFFKLLKLSGERQGESNGEVKLSEFKEVVDYEYVSNLNEETVKNAMYVIEKIILVIILIIIYKLIKKHIVGATSKREDEIREKIKIVKHKKENKFIKSIKNFINGKGTIREQIYYVFGNFQNKAYRSELYKQGMTAGELNNATKNQIKDKDDAIDDITNVYNEAKFSNHTLEKDDLEMIVNGYKEIKGEL